MTAADIPRTLGQPDQGFEGNRFTGLTMYDAADDVGPLVPRQGERHDPRARDRMEGRRVDKKKWTFKLRPGVKFHDGSNFNADAVVWKSKRC